MHIAENDARYLLAQIRACESILILGAGASLGGTNRAGVPIKGGEQLAELLATEAGLPYRGDTLPDVYEAVRGILSDVRIRRILQDEYAGTTASPCLVDLLSVSWRRLYSFNIDDSIESVRVTRTGQRRRYYNGMIDKVADFEAPAYLHVVYLHGQAVKPEHGFIFSEADYSVAVRSNQLHWYNRAGLDYLSSCPVFIGTKLDERILWAQIERAKHEESSISGLGFVITPDKLTPIKEASLRSRGVVHITATLEQFVSWLRRAFPAGNSPKDVVSHNKTISGPALDNITQEDINAVNALRWIQPASLNQTLSSLPLQEMNHRGRLFLRGFPPNWLLAASTVPVWLKRCDDILRNLSQAVDDGQKLFVVTGQAGSGKTTAIMMVLLRYLTGSSRKLYELSGDTTHIGQIFHVLKKLDEPCFVYIPDLLLVGDALADEIEKIESNEIMVVTSSRLSEWRGHYSRLLGRFCEPSIFSRFSPDDYDDLIDRLARYVPSPKFARMKRHEQVAALGRSRSQLLIALHEVTESDFFGETIAHEFTGLPDKDTRFLCLISGIATMARVGISVDMAREVYNYRAETQSLSAALNALSGIVEPSSDQRLFARHEIYIRHVIENVIDFTEFCDAVKGMLRVFAQYEVPVIRRVNKRDGALFRFLLNHDFILDVAKKHRSAIQGRNIYESFEIEFQLDGHFWLQYGLYLMRIDRHEEALAMLRRSNQAYPGNPFAQHALANLQLRIAFFRPGWDKFAEDLVQEAVATLESLDARGPLVLDTYPLVTLALGRIAVLSRHKQEKQARSLASQYQDRLQVMSRLVPDISITRAQEAMIRYATLGEEPRPFYPGQGGGEQSIRHSQRPVSQHRPRGR